MDYRAFEFDGKIGDIYFYCMKHAHGAPRRVFRIGGEKEQYVFQDSGKGKLLVFMLENLSLFFSKEKLSLESGVKLPLIPAYLYDLSSLLNFSCFYEMRVFCDSSEKKYGLVERCNSDEGIPIKRKKYRRLHTLKKYI